MKKGMFLAALAVCAMGYSVLVNDASANCLVSGKVLFTYQTQASMTVYVAPIGAATYTLPTYYYSFTTSTGTAGGAALAEKINNAQTSGARLTFNGNAASCPTTGTVRVGGTQILYVTQW